VLGTAACVALVSEDGDDANALVLFPLALEYLTVRVQFHRVAVPDLKVRFVCLDGTEVESNLATDEDGVARTSRRVPAGTYVCELERQAPAHVSTVPTHTQAFPVVLPVGRPYSALRKRAEFVVTPVKPVRSSRKS